MIHENILPYFKFQVSEDGTYAMTGMSPVGGRTLLALGSLLTGAKVSQAVGLLLIGNKL